MQQSRCRKLAIVDVAIGVLFLSATGLLNEPVVKSVLDLATLGPYARAAIWATCAGSFAWGVVTIRFRGNASFRSLNFLICSTVACLATLEVVLHAAPALLGQSFVNGLYTKYSAKPGGIYVQDPNLKMKFMIPDYKTTMLYNGYVWAHEADALGFRNRTVRIPADILLLGDSFIYGHGVQLDETVGHFLEQCSGSSVMNLGRQGDSPFQEAYLLSAYAGLFKPRLVLYFFFDNDIRDLYGDLKPQELTRFIEQPVDRISYPARAPLEVALQIRDDANRREGLLARLRDRLYLVKIVDWWQARQRDDQHTRKTESAAIDEHSLGWRYTKKAIFYMRYVAAKHGAKLLIVPIVKFDQHPRQILSKIAREYDLPILDTTHITRAASPDLFLPGDGHFNERGARVMARTVCEWLENHRSDEPG